MDNTADFIHYANTGDVVPAKRCDGNGHNYRHVLVLEHGDEFFIFCQLCHESAVVSEPREMDVFMAGRTSCNRPYHRPENVERDGEQMVCMRCEVVVREATHPSHNGETWYG